MSDEKETTASEGGIGQPESTGGLGGWWKRLLAFLWPMCPTGQHRRRMGLVTNINGNQFCWHPDCIQANLADCKTHAHHFEPEFSYAGKLFERCSCGAHRIYGETPNAK